VSLLLSYCNWDWIHEGARLRHIVKICLFGILCFFTNLSIYRFDYTVFWTKTHRMLYESIGWMAEWSKAPV
jgi:hypothetical protein